MINPKNKRVQVTLPGETVELLESLSNRYHKSYSETVKWAINVLASKRRHNIVIRLSEQNEENQERSPNEQVSDEEFLKMKAKIEPEELTEEEKKILKEFNIK